MGVLTDPDEDLKLELGDESEESVEKDEKGMNDEKATEKKTRTLLSPRNIKLPNIFSKKKETVCDSDGGESKELTEKKGDDLKEDGKDILKDPDEELKLELGDEGEESTDKADKKPTVEKAEKGMNDEKATEKKTRMLISPRNIKVPNNFSKKKETVSEAASQEA